MVDNNTLHNRFSDPNTILNNLKIIIIKTIIIKIIKDRVRGVFRTMLDIYDGILLRE